MKCRDVILLSSPGLCLMLLCGLWYSPGVIFVDLRDYMGSSSAVASWITTLQFFTNCVACAFGGLLMKHVSCRVITVTGGVTMVCGLVTSMFASCIAHLFITYGLVTGLGSGLVQMGSVTALHQSGFKKRNLYFGIAFSVSNIGVAIYPPMIQFFINWYSWRGMFLLLGGIQFHAVALALLFPSRNKSKRRSLDLNVFREKTSADETLVTVSETRHRNVRPETRETTSARFCDSSDEEQKYDESNSHELRDTNDLKTCLNKQIIPIDSKSKDVLYNEPGISSSKFLSNFITTKKQNTTNFMQTKLHTNTAEIRTNIIVQKNLCWFKFIASVTLFYLGTGILLGHLLAYALLHHISDKIEGSLFYTLYVVSMGVSKLIQGGLLNSKKISALRMYIFFTALSGLVTLILIWKVPYGLVCVCALTIGIGTAATAGAIATTLILQLTGAENFERGYGLYVLATGIGYLIGAPFAGWIFDATQTYTVPFAVAAGAILLSSGIMLGQPAGTGAACRSF